VAGDGADTGAAAEAVRGVLPRLGRLHGQLRGGRGVERTETQGEACEGARGDDRAYVQSSYGQVHTVTGAHECEGTGETHVSGAVTRQGGVTEEAGG
jgi:hypothetical protein